jgi:hypothetical protein
MPFPRLEAIAFRLPPIGAALHRLSLEGRSSKRPLGRGDAVADRVYNGLIRWNCNLI